MMKAIVEGLDDWGIPEDNIHFEAFGPATIRRKQAPEPAEPTTETFTVQFKRSGTRVRWDGTYDNLLTCAEAHDVPLDGGCRAGNCGTCTAVLAEGHVSYLADPEAQIEPGTCLTCITVPTSDLVLDA